MLMTFGHTETSAAAEFRRSEIRADDNIEKVASHCVQAFTDVHASDETSHFPIFRKLGNGRARTWHGGLHRGSQGAKAISQGRGGARLLSISAGANAGYARSPSRDESRIRKHLPTAFSCNGWQFRLLLARSH
jgi:hypothetical protein